MSLHWILGSLTSWPNIPKAAQLPHIQYHSLFLWEEKPLCRRLSSNCVKNCTRLPRIMHRTSPERLPCIVGSSFRCHVAAVLLLQCYSVTVLLSCVSRAANVRQRRRHLQISELSCTACYSKDCRCFSCRLVNSSVVNSANGSPGVSCAKTPARASL